MISATQIGGVDVRRLGTVAGQVRSVIDVLPGLAEPKRYARLAQYTLVHPSALRVVAGIERLRGQISPTTPGASEADLPVAQVEAKIGRSLTTTDYLVNHPKTARVIQQIQMMRQLSTKAAPGAPPEPVERKIDSLLTTAEGGLDVYLLLKRRPWVLPAIALAAVVLPGLIGYGIGRAART